MTGFAMIGIIQRWTSLPLGTATSGNSLCLQSQTCSLGCIKPIMGGFRFVPLPPVTLLGKVISKILDHVWRRVILIVPSWLSMPWFWNLVNLSSKNTSVPSEPTQSVPPSLQQTAPQGTSISMPWKFFSKYK